MEKSPFFNYYPYTILIAFIKGGYIADHSGRMRNQTMLSIEDQLYHYLE